MFGLILRQKIFLSSCFLNLTCSRLSVSGAYRMRPGDLWQVGSGGEIGKVGRACKHCFKTSFRYTSSRYTLWLVYFDSLYKRLVSSLSSCLMPSDVSMANALCTHDFADSQYLNFRELSYQGFPESKSAQNGAKLRELSRTMVYITRETVKRLVNSV